MARPRAHRSFVFAAALLAAAPAAVLAQSLSLGGLTVAVTRAGQPAAGATVCVGTAVDRNQFFQGVTDGQGRVSFASVPRESFVVTARLGTRGAASSYTIASPAGVPVFNAALLLPDAPGGPSCPTTPAGPDRRIGAGVAAAAARITPATIQPSIVLNLGERCFGALGAACGQPQGLVPPSALCSGGRCFINGGSWEHDECCFRNRGGVACNLPNPDDGTGTCGALFGKAIRLATKGLMWSRPVDFAERNPTGTVNHALYCAPSNTLVPPEDGAKCCSRATRALNGVEAATAVAAGETLRACR